MRRTDSWTGRCRKGDYEPEAADLVADEPQPRDLLTIEVRAIDKHVPSSVFLAVRPEEEQQ